MMDSKKTQSDEDIILEDEGQAPTAAPTHPTAISVVCERQTASVDHALCVLPRQEMNGMKKAIPDLCVLLRSKA